MSVSGEESLKVLSVWRSAFGMRVPIALKEKGLPYEYQEEDLQPDRKSQLLLQSNPVYKKIPVLLHNAKPICESINIVQYIDETWPSPHQPLLPSDPYARALQRFWADYVDRKVIDALLRIFRSAVGPEAMEQAKQDLVESAVTLDGALRDVFGGGPYFGGKHIGLVDIVLAPALCWFHLLDSAANLKVVEESSCPNLFAWSRSIVEHPSVKEVLPLSPPQNITFSRIALENRKRFV